MFAVNSTTIYSVNLTTAALTTVLDYSGHGLGTANGTAFLNEAPPGVRSRVRSPFWELHWRGSGFSAVVNPRRLHVDGFRAAPF